MHNSCHVVSFPADDDMSSSLRCVWTALPASTVGRWTEGLSLCHWHSCHLTQVIWRIRCRNGKSSQHGRVFEQIHCHSLWCMRLGLIRHFYLCLEHCTVYLMFWISMKSFGSMVSAECHMNHMNKFHVLICHNVFSTDQLKPSLDSFNTVTSDMADMVQYPKKWNTHKICRFDSYIVQIYIYIDLTWSYQHLSFTTRGSLPWQVTTLVDFLDFLQAKHPSIRKVGRWVVRKLQPRVQQKWWIKRDAQSWYLILSVEYSGFFVEKKT